MKKKNDFQQSVNELIDNQIISWELAKQNHESLLDYCKSKKEIELRGDEAEIYTELFLNPKRIISTSAKTDDQSIQQRKCFLCEENRPSEQEYIPFKQYQILLNPYPIFEHHLVIADGSHVPQSIAERFKDMLDLAANLKEFYILYNGPACGASAPDHAHFQAADKSALLPATNWKYKDIIDEENRKVYYTSSAIKSFNFTSKSKKVMIQLLGIIQEALSLDNPGKEPMMNIVAWYGLEGPSEQFCNDDEPPVWTCIVFPRSKHRPDCYYAKGEDNLLISPAVSEMCGVFPIVLEKDLVKMTAEKITAICKEVSLSDDDFEKALEHIKASL